MYTTFLSFLRQLTVDRKVSAWHF